MKGYNFNKIVESLNLPGQPKRYVVTNTKKIVLVTYDPKYANRVAESLKEHEDPTKFFVKMP